VGVVVRYICLFRRVLQRGGGMIVLWSYLNIEDHVDEVHDADNNSTIGSSEMVSKTTNLTDPSLSKLLGE
jgi:hypothetical protein